MLLQEGPDSYCDQDESGEEEDDVEEVDGELETDDTATTVSGDEVWVVGILWTAVGVVIGVVVSTTGLVLGHPGRIKGGGNVSGVNQRFGMEEARFIKSYEKREDLK